MSALRGRRWREVREVALHRAGWRCARCGKARRLEVHHRVPLFRGGAAYDQANLEVLCRACHFGEHETESRKARREWNAFVWEGCG
ncbi:MAG: HNH endonuclease [Alphaproteobacteria bacterium]|nr:HNH endonuclease [Alphaproteobacteria bacterium]